MDIQAFGSWISEPQCLLEGLTQALVPGCQNDPQMPMRDIRPQTSLWVDPLLQQQLHSLTMMGIPSNPRLLSTRKAVFMNCMQAWNPGMMLHNAQSCNQQSLSLLLVVIGLSMSLNG